MQVEFGSLLGDPSKVRDASQISGGPAGQPPRLSPASAAAAQFPARFGNGGAAPDPSLMIPQLQALQNRLEALEDLNQTVGEGEHAAPLGVATVKVLTQLERRVAGIEKDLGVTYRFKSDHPLPLKLKEGNQAFNKACQAFKGKKDAEGKPILAPPCWGFVQLQLTEYMIADTTTLEQDKRDQIDKLRRLILETPSGNPSADKLQNFWKVCSTATVTVASKVAFVELRRHERASESPDAPEYILRETFHEYLTRLGEAQIMDRAPAPGSRDLRSTLQTMGYLKGSGKGKGNGY